MAKEVDLFSYWLPALKKLREFREIANAEEPELKALLEAIDTTLDNMFIETADENGIKHFEKIMGIYPEAGDSLETRRFKVLLKWNDKVPYTDNELYNKLYALCGGEDKFSIEEDYKNYKIYVTTNLGVVGTFDLVIPLLEEILPCNMELTLSNALESTATATLTAGAVITTAMHYQIT